MPGFLFLLYGLITGSSSGPSCRSQMALDWPAFGDALWKVSDRLGIRPEWQLPVIALESGFNRRT